MTLSDIRANDVIITESASPTWSERILRRVCTEMGSEGGAVPAAAQWQDDPREGHRRHGQPGDPHRRGDSRGPRLPTA